LLIVILILTGTQLSVVVMPVQSTRTSVRKCQIIQFVLFVLVMQATCS